MSGDAFRGWIVSRWDPVPEHFSWDDLRDAFAAGSRDAPLGELADSPLRRSFVWQYPAEVDRVIDGDSVEMHVALGPEHELHGQRVRVDGINAIELSQKFGAEARDHLASLLPPGADVTLVVRKREKYGRMLARIILPDGRDASQEMLVAKASDGVTPLAVPYNP